MNVFTPAELWLLCLVAIVVIAACAAYEIVREQRQLARHQAACERCGVRCDRCEERMCINGPEPRACGTTCTDCDCDCTPCWDARIDAEMERLVVAEREARAGL